MLPTTVEAQTDGLVGDARITQAPVLSSYLFPTGPLCTVAIRTEPRREGMPPRSSAPGGPAVRPQLAVRIRRLAISFGPLLPVAITLAICGKRWL